ncbi:scoloptoxin SSD14-like isoform X2 [Daktulosphaira vitifoliae]|uniref:scoloptoxin SSD14-like isoform X2 n=1 Tax=Daktulosphaira vitifoliae TaxID=58002 RepID=UPI0021AADE9C|nr:scoloptoxin SSD14-like isoform X2 [Daktulosphaira vitifoliae]
MPHDEEDEGYFSGMAVLAVFVSLLIVYSHHAKTPSEPGLLDVQYALPPSNMKMGVYSKAAVVSNGEPCANIGRNILKKGGNAIDAIIATLICDGVFCPEYMGLGGGILMTIYNRTTKMATEINAREIAPAAANKTMYTNEPMKAQRGGMAIAVPGELKGYWIAYNKYGGGVPWKELFEPTIKHCKQGIVVSERLANNLVRFEDLILNTTTIKNHFVDHKTGRIKKAGDIYKLPKLARSLRIIAKNGADALYNGKLTAKLLKDIKNCGGIITAEDMANYKVKINEAFNVDLKNGYRLHAGIPPSSGVILAYILRLLDGKLPGPNAGLDAHRLVEAYKFAYGERTRIGDHNFVKVNQIFKKIKSDQYIENIKSKINDYSTSLNPKYYGAEYDIPIDHGTANVVVLDAMGNAVVATSTINTIFGSGVMSKSTGIIMNNEMDDFSIPGIRNSFGIPSSPANYIQPGKRPMSSMCPSIITDNKGDVILALGAAGGSKITLATAYVIALTMWYNKTLKEAIDEPRIYHQLIPMRIDYEYGLLKNVVNKLKEIGHPVNRLTFRGGSAVTAIHKNRECHITAMADFRRPGNTSGY